MASIPTLGRKVANIAYLLILSTGGTGKACEQWEDKKVGLKTWQDFNDHLSQAYRQNHICNKTTIAAHGYGASVNHTQEIYAQVNTRYALQELAYSATEDKEAMTNLISINLTLFQSPMQAQEKMLVLSK